MIMSEETKMSDAIGLFEGDRLSDNHMRSLRSEVCHALIRSPAIINGDDLVIFAERIVQYIANGAKKE